MNGRIEEIFRNNHIITSEEIKPIIIYLGDKNLTLESRIAVLESRIAALESKPPNKPGNAPATASTSRQNRSTQT